MSEVEDAARYGLLDMGDADTRLLVPLPGRPWHYVQHSDRDTLVVRAALGERQRPIHADLYAFIRNMQVKRGDDEPRQYRIANFARQHCCSVRTVSRALHDLAEAGLIEIEADLPYRLSPLDGNLYSWVHDETGTNSYERAADAFARDLQATVPESFRQVQDDLAAGLALVAEAAGSGRADEATTAKVAAMLAEAARLLAGGDGGHEPPGGGGGGGPEPPDGPGGTGSGPADDGREAADDACDLPGYAELADADMRADKGGDGYQAAAREAYRALLADKLGPSPDEVARAYGAYGDALAADGKEAMRRPLGRWLASGDEYGARAGIRRLRRSRPQPARPKRPDTVPCPRCGHDAVRLGGDIYQCANIECDFADPFSARAAGLLPQRE